MKKSEFITLLENPDELGIHHIQGLQEAASEFPYFQSVQLLLTKAFHKSENINFEGQLKKAAAFATDRKRLHQLIFDQYSNQKDLISEDSIEIPIVPDYSETSIAENSLGVENSKDANLQASDDVEGLDQSFIPDFGLVSEEDNSKKEAAEEKLEEQLQKQVLTEAIHQSILLEVDDQITEKVQEDEEQRTGNVPQEHSENDQSNFANFDEDTAHSFSDWLNFYKEEQEAGASKTSMLWENASEESKEAIAAFKPKTNLPVRQEFYSASKMAKLSVQEDDDLVTETLANIYVEQGYIEKAIKAFEKLQLKYPEKRVYFAGQIKKIEDHLNS